MTRNGKLTKYGSGLAKLFGGGDRSWEFPRRRLPIYASWIEPTLVGSSGANGMWLWSILRRLLEP